MDDALKHYGVLGMRWGYRRGQPVRRQTMLTKSRQANLDNRELSSLENRRGLRSARQKKTRCK